MAVAKYDSPVLVRNGWLFTEVFIASSRTLTQGGAFRLRISPLSRHLVGWSLEESCLRYVYLSCLGSSNR